MDAKQVLSTSDAVELPPENLNSFSRRVWTKTLYAAIEWFAHCLIVAVILLGMKGLEVLSGMLWEGERLFFGHLISIEGLFATADFVLLVVILILGVGCVIKAYRSS